MKVYSHPRSGTNFLLAMLEKAFMGSVTVSRMPCGHWSARQSCKAPSVALWGGHQFYTRTLTEPRLYIYRDGRDVALSLWRTKTFQASSWHALPFTEFLRQPLDWRATPGKRADTGLTIVEHWKAHLDAWRGRPAYYVRYDELLRHPAAVLDGIAQYIDMRVLSVPEIAAGQGPEPSGDYRAAKWRDVYSDSDLDYFHSIVPTDYWGLGGAL